jgi:hypothetical protein
VVNSEAQVAAVRQEAIQGFELSDFANRNIDPETVLLRYKLVLTGSNADTYWVSSVWHLEGHEWRTVLHTAAEAVLHDARRLTSA